MPQLAITLLLFCLFNVEVGIGALVVVITNTISFVMLLAKNMRAQASKTKLFRAELIKLLIWGLSWYFITKFWVESWQSIAIGAIIILTTTVMQNLWLILKS